MTSQILTVDAAARVLELHPKTVLRFIREGRLRATKVGRQYRVLQSDLNAFAGVVSAAGAAVAKATSIVDIENVDLVLVQRLSSLLFGATRSSEPPATPISLDIVHDPVRHSVKVIVMSSPADAATLLTLIETCLESHP